MNGRVRERLRGKERINVPIRKIILLYPYLGSSSLIRGELLGFVNHEAPALAVASCGPKLSKLDGDMEAAINELILLCEEHVTFVTNYQHCEEHT